MKTKSTIIAALLIVVCSIAFGQTSGKESGGTTLPEIFNELKQSPPSPEMMQTKPDLFSHLMKRRLQLAALLQKEVQEGRLPKSALEVLKEVKQSPIAQPGLKTDKNLTTNFQLVKDINTAADGNPYNYDYTFTPGYAVLNKIIYYAANDGINGTELWRSDGTDTGTYQVKNIAAGSASGSPQFITVFNGKIYFQADDGINGSELYQSNGTAAGTILFKDIEAGAGSSFPSRLKVANGSLYFVTLGNTNNSTQYSKLWKTDGTAANTVLVVDLYTILSSGNIAQLTAVNSLLFFTAYNFTYGRELWRSDGTAAGTFMVKDINPFNNNGYGDDGNGPSNLTFYNNMLYFSANDAGNLRTLWVSNGSNANTNTAPNNNGVILANTYYSNYQDQPFAIAKNALFFAGTLPATGTELYKYDASNIAGAVLVKDISTSTVSSDIQNEQIRSMNDTIYFSTLDFTGTVPNLWKSAGTSATTTIVKSLPGLGYGLYSIGKNLFFSVRSAANGYEPWISDGTATGTKILKDINTGSFSSYPREFTLCNGKIYFTAFTVASGNELWNTAGTAATTKLIKDVNTTATSWGAQYGNYLRAVAVDTTTIIFTGNEPSTGYEPWKSDGSAAGTTIIKDLLPGDAGNDQFFYAGKNGKAYFRAYDYTTGLGLDHVYITNGTAAGTKSIATASGYIYNIKVADNGTVFYVIYNNSYELWRTDSLGNNYRLNKDADNNIGVAGNLCFFNGASAYGRELWKSDGTIAGTNLIADINPGAGNSYPYGFQTLGSQVIFTANNGVNNYTWASDGTTAGTTLLKTINPNLYSSTCVSNGKLYFSGNESVNGSELWSTNGTSAGTVLIKDIYAGTTGSNPGNFTEAGGIVFFMADDGINGYELWKTNGNPAGTKLVKNIAPGIDGSYYTGNFTSAGGKLYFTDTSLLWVSDGTAAGTKKVLDPNLSAVTGIGFLCGTGNRLFFSGVTYTYGCELYAGDARLAAFAPVAAASREAVTQKTNGFSAAVMPNPVHNTALIQVSGARGKVQIILTNMNGDVLWQSASAFQNSCTIDVSKFADGTYMVLVKDDAQTKALKLIKE